MSQFTDKTVVTKNLLGKIGANLSHFFIYDGFGAAAFIIPVLLFVSGFYWLFRIPFRRVVKTWNWGIIVMLWFSITLGFVNDQYVILAGIIGVEINEYLQTFLGANIRTNNYSSNFKVGGEVGQKIGKSISKCRLHKRV